MKTRFLFIVLIFALFGAIAFEWPIKDFSPEKTSATFGQNREQRFNSSLIFTNTEEVVAADKGNVIIVILEHQNDGNWFESTLGNCIVIAHEDNLISVYGNLEKQSAENNLLKNTVTSGETIGLSENSAWNESANSLEFQISDNSGKTFINPLILMPRISNQQRLTLDGLSLKNKLGRSYELSTLRSLPAGVYSVLKTRKSNVLIHSSSVYVNGSELEKITKDTLTQKNSLLTLSGQSAYSSTEFYFDSEIELLGHILLPHGSNTVAITIKDFFENERSATFNIQGY